MDQSGKRTILLFANPKAGRGKGAALLNRLRMALSAGGFDPHCFDQPAGQLPDAQWPEAADVAGAIVIGGDGTLRHVADALASRYQHHMPPLLPIGLGTANLVCRHLNSPWNHRLIERQVLHRLLHGQRIELDAARANEALLLAMGGVGFDAGVVHEMTRMRRGPIRYSSYLSPTLWAISRQDFPPLEVEVDGQSLLKNRAAMVLIGNIPEYGTGVPIIPDARADDGLLDVCIIPCNSRLELARRLAEAALAPTLTAGHNLARKHLGEKGPMSAVTDSLRKSKVYSQKDWIRARGRDVQVRSSRPAAVQIDGDAWGFTPLRVRLLPWRIPFIVSGK